MVCPLLFYYYSPIILYYSGIVIVVGVIAALVWSARHKYGAWQKAGVVLATLLVIYAVPFGDHTLGEIKKHQLCKELGSTKIYQVVENVEGFMWARSGGQGNPPHTTYGYTFSEESDLNSRIYRYTKRPDGSVDSQIAKESQARYVARSAPYEDIGLHHSARKFTIVDVRDNKVLATHGLVAYHGGWLGFGSVTCPHERFDAIAFLQQVLKPGKLKE